VRLEFGYEAKLHVAMAAKLVSLMGRQSWRESDDFDVFT